MKTDTRLVIALAMLLVAGVVGAAERYWVGAAGANWSVTTSWSEMTGGAPGASVPGVDDVAIFDGGGINNAIVDASFSGAVGAVDIRSGYTGTITQHRHLTISNAGSGSGNFSIAQGATWNYTAGTAAELTVHGNMTVHGTIQCQRTAATAGTEGIGRTFSVGGDLLVGPTGVFDADGQGFNAGSGPGGMPAYTGAAHGGLGGNRGAGTATGNTYGSLVNPTALGSGSQGAGGGAIILTVLGAAAVNGTISANGAYSAWGGGAGGSINLTAATLSGAGTVRAHGGENMYDVPSGGGRIALVVTGPGADFSSFTGPVTAYGTPGLSYSCAGTVYWQTEAQGPGMGTLTIDDGGTAPAAALSTLISSSVADNAVGNVVIRNAGHLRVDAGQTLTVQGDWSNTATFSAGAGGLVDFVGPATATLTGSTTFNAFRCIAAGKTLRFTNGHTFTTTGTLILTGAEGNLVTLESTTPGEQFNFRAQAGCTQADISYLSVTDSNADGGDTITVIDSADGGNNVNWTFTSLGPIVWAGASSTDWNTPGNWDLGRTPLQGDPSITIPAPSGGSPSNWPALDKSYLSPGYDGDLIVQSGATLYLAGYSLRIGGDVTVAGTLTATGSQTLAFEGDVNFTNGTFNRGQSTLRLAGTAAQILTTGGNTFYALDITNTAAITVTGSFTTRDLTFPATSANVSFGGGFTATDMRLVVSGGATLTFAADQSYTVNNQLLLRGTAGNPVVLTSSGTWSLNANGYTAARFVEVTDSNASGGRTIYAVDSTGHGSNPNWNFGDGKVWVGADTAWATPANWSPSGVPTATDVVLIDGSTNTIPRLQAGTTIAGLIVAGVSGAAALTIDMPYAGADVLTVAGNVDVGANGTLTHTANGATAVQRLRMDVGGNLTVASSGAIDVDAKGYSANNGPGGTPGYNAAGHGGQGGNRYATTAPGQTYGSIVNPVMLGSSSDGRGGGAAIITVAGASRIDGTLSATGGYGAWGPGAGGSINLTTATLTGSGTIRANGGARWYEVPAGGGRIALALTGADADFTTFAGSVTAYGTPDYPSACGTIYKQTAAQESGTGTLIIDNGNITQPTAPRTLISSSVIDAAVGDVVIHNLGHLRVDTDQTLTVYGNWSNTATFSAAAGGLVDFAGSATATLAGNTTFDTFRCIVPGKTLRFTAGSTQSVTSGLALTGADGNLLVLESTNPAEQWTISALPGSTQHDVSYLSVSNSIAGADPITAMFSDDQGGNENWTFSNPAAIVWTGASSTDWNTPGNWDLGRTPLRGDPSITIPGAPANQPVLDKSYLSPGYDGDLIVQSGATLNLAGYSLRIGGNVTVAGTLTATGSQTLAFERDVDFTGTFNRGQSTLRLAGTAAQVLTTGGNSFYAIDIANTAAITIAGSFTTRDLTFPSTSANVSFGGGFTATDMRLVVSGGATLTFAAGQAYTVNNQLLLRGAAWNPVVLTSSGTWSLNANGYTAARYVNVTDSNASGGRMLYAVDSTGHGSNPNWNFGNGKVWVGTDTAWGTPENWSPSGVPTATDVVLIDGATNTIPRLQAGTTIAGLIVADVSGAATLTVDLPYAGPDVLSVTGNVDVGAGGTLTHTANGATAVQRLRMHVGGNFTLAAGGAINVDARGFSANNGPGGVAAYNGPSHGGRGGNRSASSATGITYGSPVNPVTLGSGSQGAGGGAVIITVGGAAVIDGTMSAVGGHGGWGGGSGGSVNLTSSTLSGSGPIRADGGANSYDVPAGGGRIALKVTGPGADFSNYTGAVTAYGTPHLSYSCAGTVYRQTAAQSGGRGTLTIDNRGSSPTAALRTQIPSVYDPSLGELRYASVIVTNRGALAVTTNDRIGSLTVVSANEPLNLGPVDATLEVSKLTVNGTPYTRAGLYKASDWNGFSPTPSNVTGDGTILITAKGSLFLLR